MLAQELGSSVRQTSHLVRPAPRVEVTNHTARPTAERSIRHLWQAGRTTRYEVNLETHGAVRETRGPLGSLGVKHAPAEGERHQDEAGPVWARTDGENPSGVPPRLLTLAEAGGAAARRLFQFGP